MTTEPTLAIRTGCLACRARGVPCDPYNEGCKRFTSTTWSSNRSLERWGRTKRKKIFSTWNPESSQGIRSLEQTWAGTLKERQSLHFFTVITSRELSGLLDTKFWQIMLLQAAQSDNAIKHAVAAIGASHEHQLRKQASRLNAETDGLEPFALRQCNKAIAALIRPSNAMDQRDIRRALTASLLLACFESFIGNRQGAIPHVIYSRKLLEQSKRKQLEHKSSKSEPFPINLDMIEPLVAHYEVQVGDYVDETNPDGMIKTFDLKVPLEFNRLADARVSLESAIANLSIVCWNLDRSCSNEDIRAAKELKSAYPSWLRAWDRQFSNFLSEEYVNLDQDTLDGCRHVTYGNGEGVWSTFASRFGTVVELIAEILKNLPKKGPASQVPQTPYLSATMGMTEPLYCVVARCTDETIVDRAKKLLAKLPLSEGIHSSWKIAFIEKTLCAATGKRHIEPG